MPRIVVVGSLNMDLVMQAPRLPVLGETVLGGTFSTAEGGKGANQAVACARLGATTAMIGRVGKDDFGIRLRSALELEGVDVSEVRIDPEAATGVAQIFVVGGDNGILVAPGANAFLSPDDVREASSMFDGASCALFQLEVPLESVLAGLRAARARGVRTILNPAPWMVLSDEVLALTDVFVPNRIELEQFVSSAPETCGGDDLLGRGAARAFALGVRTVVVTAGSEGAYLFDNGARISVKSPDVRTVDSTGAGDAFVAALSVTLAEGCAPSEAVRFAVCAGALACTSLGAQPSLPRRNQVEQLRRSLR